MKQVFPRLPRPVARFRLVRRVTVWTTAWASAGGGVTPFVGRLA